MGEAAPATNRAWQRRAAEARSLRRLVSWDGNWMDGCGGPWAEQTGTAGWNRQRLEVGLALLGWAKAAVRTREGEMLDMLTAQHHMT